MHENQGLMLENAELRSAMESLRSELAAARGGRRHRHSMGGVASAEALEPLPPDSACWDWPLSRHEKKARVHLLERKMNAMDRENLIQELCYGPCESDAEGSAC